MISREWAEHALSSRKVSLGKMLNDYFYIRSSRKVKIALKNAYHSRIIRLVCRAPCPADNVGQLVSFRRVVTFSSLRYISRRFGRLHNPITQLVTVDHQDLSARRFMRAAQILDRKEARLPIDVQEGAVTQEGRAYFTVQNSTRSIGAIFSACTAVSTFVLALSTGLRHVVNIYAVQSQLFGTLSAFETHEWNHVWNTSRAQQKDKLLPEDPGSIGDSLHGHSARYFVLWNCTRVHVHRFFMNGGVLEFGSPLIPRSYLRAADRDQAAQ
jgi:hypothetical protein